MVARAQQDSSRELLVAFLRTSDGDYYMVAFTSEAADDAVRYAGSLAANRELGFGWCDAAIMARDIMRAVA